MKKFVKNIEYWGKKRQPGRKSTIIYGIHARIIRFLILLNIIIIALSLKKNPLAALNSVRNLVNYKRTLAGQRIFKFSRTNNHYYFSLYIPGWPSREFTSFFRTLLGHNNNNHSQSGYMLITVIMAITKQCTLHCEHCFAGKWINKKETLSSGDLKSIVKNLAACGCSQIQISGGEPLLRYPELRDLLLSIKPGPGFLLLTSGMGMTREKAIELYAAGLRGVIVSLDHYEASYHNRFRGHPEAFSQAIAAIKYSQEAGLETSVCLCPTKEFFIDRDNLINYYEYVKNLGVSFLRILEPLEAGRLCDQNNLLGNEELLLLEDFFIKANRERKYSTYPVVMYPAYHQRHSGCLGAGRNFLNIDADGNVQPCPFNDYKAGNCLNESIEQIIVKMKNMECNCVYKLKRYYA